MAGNDAESDRLSDSDSPIEIKMAGQSIRAFLGYFGVKTTK